MEIPCLVVMKIMVVWNGINIIIELCPFFVVYFNFFSK